MLTAQLAPGTPVDSSQGGAITQPSKKHTFLFEGRRLTTT
jgi:hypothetical protein